MAGPIPARAARPRLTRGLTGDTRPNLMTPMSVQVIDAEWDTPAAFLVTGLSQGIGSPTWTLRTGLDRGVLVPNYQVTNDFFSAIVIARSIALSAVQNAQALGPGYLQAVAVPIDLSFDATAFQNAQNGANLVGVISPLVHSLGVINPVAASVASVQLASGSGAGVAVMNVSPAGRNLYVLLSTGAAAIGAGGFTFGPIAPNGYYETPFGYTGPVQGIWDGADALGYANITAVV